MLPIVLSALLVWLLVGCAVQYAAGRAAALASRRAPTCFKAAPAVSSDAPIRIAFLGDLQKGVTDVIRPLREALEAERAHLLVSSGDFVSHGEGPYYGLVLDAFADANVQTPTRVVPGNHDLYPRRSKDDRIGGPHFERHFGARHWTLDVGPVVLIGLDTGGDWLIEDQLPEMTAALSQRAGRPWIAVTHRPPFDFDNPKAPLYADLGPLATYFEANNPALVVAGHLHTFIDREVRGVRYLVNAHGGDVAGTSLRRSDFEVVYVDVTPEGQVTTRVERYPRRIAWGVLRNKFWVRVWADRRKPLLRVLGLPGAAVWKLLGKYEPVVHHPVQRRYPTREEVQARKQESSVA